MVDGRVFDIGADHIGGRTMCIDVVGTVLRVVFEHENGRLSPDGTVRNMVDKPAQGKIVVSNHGDRFIVSFGQPARVIVRQVNSRKMWNAVNLYKRIEVLFEKLLAADILGIEIPA